MIRRALPAVLAALLVACGGAADPAASPAAATTAVTTAATSTVDDANGTAGATVVPAALDFTAPLIGGGEIELDSLAGRPVLLWFWAPW